MHTSCVRHAGIVEESLRPQRIQHTPKIPKHATMQSLTKGDQPRAPAERFVCCVELRWTRCRVMRDSAGKPWEGLCVSQSAAPMVDLAEDLLKYERLELLLSTEDSVAVMHQFQQDCEVERQSRSGLCHVFLHDAGHQAQLPPHPRPRWWIQCVHLGAIKVTWWRPPSFQRQLGDVGRLSQKDLSRPRRCFWRHLQWDLGEGVGDWLQCRRSTLAECWGWSFQPGVQIHCRAPHWWETCDHDMKQPGIIVIWTTRWGRVAPPPTCGFLERAPRCRMTCWTEKVKLKHFKVDILTKNYVYVNTFVHKPMLWLPSTRLTKHSVRPSTEKGGRQDWHIWARRTCGFLAQHQEEEGQATAAGMVQGNHHWASQRHRRR